MLTLTVSIPAASLATSSQWASRWHSIWDWIRARRACRLSSSTSAECADIARSVGGEKRVVEISGSRAPLRFTGPQIRRFWKTSPAEWQAAVEIHVVRSFVPSLLAGKSVPIDFGDGAGMNLLDLEAGDWSQALLDATAPGLRGKLKAPVKSATVVGELAPFFVK
jgi:xylulokinase